MLSMYPKTNAELLESPYAGKDDFFLVARVTRNVENGEWLVNFESDLPAVANNKKIQRRVFEETGEEILTKADILSGNHDLGEGIRTVGAGVFLWLENAQNETKIALLKKDANAPTSANCWAQPSGLASDYPILTMFREMNEETGILSVDDNNKTVIVNGFMLPQDIYDADPSFVAQVFEEKEKSLESIKQQIAKHYPEYSGYDVVFSTDPIETRVRNDTQALEKVRITVPDGSASSFRGIIFDDVEKNSFNLHIPIQARIDLPFPLAAVDPEGYGREGGILSRNELRALEKTNSTLGHYREGLEKGFVPPAPVQAPQPKINPT